MPYTLSSGYRGLPRSVFAAFTAAALAETGFILVSKKNGIRPSNKPGSFHLWKAIVGQTAASYWTQKNWITHDEGITGEGIKRLTERMAGGSYGTSADLISAMRQGIRKGGSVEIDGIGTFNFDKEI